MTKIIDAINPSHYKGVLVIPASKLANYIQPNGDLSLEYIDIMQFTLTEAEFVGHLKGQVFKYQLRAGKKDDIAQEFQKSGWYLDRLVKYFKNA